MLVPANNSHSEEYTLALAAYMKLFQEFEAGLANERHDTLEELMDCRNRLDSVKEREFFMQGFKLGAKLVLEIMAQ